MLEMSYNTRGNRYKLVPKLCKYKLRKQFLLLVNRVKLRNVLPDKVVSDSSVCLTISVQIRALGFMGINYAFMEVGVSPPKKFGKYRCKFVPLGAIVIKVVTEKLMQWDGIVPYRLGGRCV